jgi:myo-inositol-1(or 4)-monophosphatase
MNHEELDMFGFADDLVKSAGLKLLENRHSDIKVREKTSQMDLVTEQDLLIERYLAEAIASKYPGHGILTEESQVWSSTERDGYTWVLDPIDGTVNYYRFRKDYAISLALYRDANPVWGLVYDVASGLMYGAGYGAGARINGRSLNNLPGGRERLSKAVVAMSLRTMAEMAGMGMDVLNMLSRVQAHRYLGCASLELCKVANGEYDLFISSNVYAWDVAAARIFLEERGGVFLSRAKEKSSSRCGKLFVAAFRSPFIWREALTYFPECIRKQYGF